MMGHTTHAPVLVPVLDPAAWAEATFGTVAVGDRRHTQRVVATATALAADSSALLPAALGHPAAVKATYRLLHDEAVTVAALTAPHRDQTLTAAGAVPVVLLAQDTTELDYSHHPATTGLGPIGDGRGRGYLLQSVLAVVPAHEDTPRHVLGLAHLESFLRHPAPHPGEGTRARHARPRESDVWARAATEVGPPPPDVCWVHVGDRGADIFAFLTACRAQGADFLVRAAQDRRATVDAQATHVLTQARTLPAVGTRELTLPARPRQPARTAHVAIAWTALTVTPPGFDRTNPPLPCWVVRVWEPAPPPGVDAVEWVLLTSVAVTDAERAWTRVDWYGQRWLVAEDHRCLKTGCRLEAARLRDVAALWRLVGLRAPEAVRLLQLREAARTDPALPAVCVVPPAVVAVVAAKTGQPPAMTVATCWRMIARLGGHQGRRSDGDPGWQTLWRGWRYVQTLLEGVQLASSLPDP